MCHLHGCLLRSVIYGMSQVFVDYIYVQPWKYIHGHEYRLVQSLLSEINHYSSMHSQPDPTLGLAILNTNLLTEFSKEGQV